MTSQSAHFTEAVRLNAIDLINETPDLKILLLGLDDNQSLRVLDYVMGVITECVNLGHAEIMIFGSDEGLLGYLTLFKFSKINGVSVDYVERLLVTEKYRGIGIGTRLMNAAIHKCKNLSLTSTKGSKGFYERLGFEAYAESPEGNPIMRNHDKDERVDFRLNNTDIANIINLLK